MNTIKQTLFFNWHFMRWLRLGLGAFIAIQAVKTHDALSGLIAVFFLFQAVTNTGCCGSQGCSTPVSKNNSDKIEDVEFEEIKSSKH
ncbi:MAG: hypothetical protein ACYDCN_04845 [Bacteroidia bacterium]